MESYEKPNLLLKPKISVIIPTFNRSVTLKRALESVFKQSSPADEIIVVDDGSTDGTSSLLLSYKLPQLKILSLSQNKGVSFARNRGIEKSQGDWLAFLDSDDEWLPNKLEVQTEAILSSSQLKVIHGEEIWIRNGRRVNPKKKHQKLGGRIFKNCVDQCMMSPSSILIDRSIFNELGLFNEDYPVCEDYDFWLRICEKYEVGFVEVPVLKKYGGHADQLSQRYKAMDYWRVKSLCQYLDSTLINKDEQRYLCEQIIKKSDILLKGYIKHKNLVNYFEIKSLRDLAISKELALKDTNEHKFDGSLNCTEQSLLY